MNYFTNVKIYITVFGPSKLKKEINTIQKGLIKLSKMTVKTLKMQ